MSAWQLIKATWSAFGNYEWIIVLLPSVVFVAIAITMKGMRKPAIFNIRAVLLLTCFPLSIISFIVHSESSTFFFLNNAGHRALQSGVTLAHRDYCHPIGETDASTRQAFETRLHSADLLWLTSNSSHDLKPLAKEAAIPCDLTPVVRPDYRVVGDESEETYMIISRSAACAFMLAQALGIILSASLTWSFCVSRRHRPTVAAPLP